MCSTRARSEGANVRALRALNAVAGKREGRGVKVNLAPRAGNFAFARDDSLELDIAGLLSTLEDSEATIPVGEGAGHTRDAESVRKSKRVKLLYDSHENQQQSEGVDAFNDGKPESVRKRST